MLNALNSHPWSPFIRSRASKLEEGGGYSLFLFGMPGRPLPLRVFRVASASGRHQMTGSMGFPNTYPNRFHHYSGGDEVQRHYLSSSVASGCMFWMLKRKDFGYYAFSSPHTGRHGNEVYQKWMLCCVCGAICSMEKVRNRRMNGIRSYADLGEPSGGYRL
ncbi:hypothetical protein BOTBODRAFT_534076 [Botryobasidium botryosum FD-172 SS1]|uniref:Uncharacterized protein n=1 Tax=Botryobasidium botryosum (strain FD-172 SS1) TaxID=930990 RepID=A0A067MC69_BOTB1|nr:hypothetical protein BOTBODRAFT_534076 [Botryobasidium botryosum FD-172 SS1]